MLKKEKSNKIHTNKCHNQGDTN